jgi:hypothetical protein
MKNFKTDKYGLMVNTRISDHDMRIIEKLDAMLRAKKEEVKKNACPRNPDGTIWCESC